MATKVVSIANKAAGEHVFNKGQDAPHARQATVYSAVAYTYSGSQANAATAEFPLPAGGYFTFDCRSMNTIRINAEAGNLGRIAIVYEE